LVATPSDFGKLSGGASHPGLIDWLARRFVDSKWSVKAMHRLIVNSATYRQSSRYQDSKAETADPENTLLWRFRPRRLEAEAVRDAVLAVSGRLNPEQSGLPIFPPLPEGLAEEVKYDDSKWAAQDGPEGRKRSIYIYQQRSMTMPFMQTFDSVVCDASRDRRQVSVTPLQALAMYNGRFANEEATHFAARVRKHAGESPVAQVQMAFKIALGREPSSDESERMQALMKSSAEGSDALAAVCRVLLNANEFVYVE